MSSSFGTPEPDLNVTYRFTGMLNQNHVGADSQTFAFEFTRYGVSDRITKTETETEAEILALFDFLDSAEIVQFCQVTKSYGTQLATGTPE